MGRRSGRIPWDAIRDDTAVSAEPIAYADADDCRATLLAIGERFRLDRQAGQPVRLEVWSEAAVLYPVTVVA